MRKGLVKKLEARAARSPWYVEADLLAAAERIRTLETQLEHIAAWCESHTTLQARGGTPDATLEGRFRWACDVIEVTGHRARRALDGEGT